jgi:hypothetical protein
VGNPSGFPRPVGDEANVDGHIAVLREKSQGQGDIVRAAINDGSVMHYNVLAGMRCQERSLEAQKRLVFTMPFAVSRAAI